MGCRLWGRTESDMTEATEQQQHTVSLLLQCLFPSSGKWWPLSGSGAHTSHCGGFSCLAAQALEHAGFSSFTSWALDLWLRN